MPQVRALRCNVTNTVHSLAQTKKKSAYLISMHDAALHLSDLIYFVDCHHCYNMPHLDYPLLISPPTSSNYGSGYALNDLSLGS